MQPMKPPAPATASKLKVLLCVEALSHGHVSRALGVATRLAAMGVQLELATAPQASTWFAALKLPTHAYVAPDTTAIYRRLAELGPMYSDAEIAAQYAEDAQMLRTVRPDMVISEFRIPVLQLARAQGIPTVSITEASVIPGFDMSTGPLPDAVIRPAWLPRSVADVLYGPWVRRHIVPRMARGLAEGLRRAAREHGGKQWDGYIDYVSDADRVLVCDLPELWPEVKLRPQDRFVGPQLLTDGAPLPATLDRLPRPWVAVSLGTQPALDASLIWRAVDALLSDGRSVIVSLGGQTLPCPLTHERLRVIPFANDDALFPQLQALVYPGGSGTTWKALKHGAPLITIPAHPNQHFLSLALKRAGRAELLYPRHFKPQQLVQAVRRAAQAQSTACATWEQRLARYDAGLSLIDGLADFLPLPR